MSDTLQQLLFDGIIDEIVSRLKSGKEADVWLVHHEGELVAAKIYKERSTRSFKNNAGYVEGRRVRNTRTQRAIEKGTRFGQEAAEEAWKSAEADSLYRLHAAGVRVPAPRLFYEGVLLMELVNGPDGGPAPRLIECAIAPGEARALYEDLRGQVVRMLCADLIHGDLSPYNVLLSAQGPTIIDFPQTVAAAVNRQAAFFFKRDLENLRRFFAGFDRGLRAAASDAAEIWAAYERRELSPDFVPTGRFEPAPKPVTPATTLQEMLRELAQEELRSRPAQGSRKKRKPRADAQNAKDASPPADRRGGRGRPGEGGPGGERREVRQHARPAENGKRGKWQGDRRGEPTPQRRRGAPGPRREPNEPLVVHIHRLSPTGDATTSEERQRPPRRPPRTPLRPR